MQFDCQSCGACCSNYIDPKWIEVTEEDAKLIGDDSLLQPGDIAKYAMKQTPSGACIAFAGRVGESCGCTIYNRRPAVCRNLKQGDPICLGMRLNNLPPTPK